MYFVSLILGLFLAASPAYALTVPEKPASYVTDTASLLSSGTKQQLEGILGDFEKETSNQVLVAIFPSLDGQVLEDFSIKLAEKWKAGTKKNDNGVILLVFRDDHAIRIEVGYGLEGPLPDALAGQIIRNEITPAFRQGDFDGGVLKGVTAILQATRGEYKASAPTEDPMEKYAPLIFFGLFFYFLLPVLCYGLVMVACVASLGLPGAFLGIGLVMALEFFRRLLFSARFGNTFSGRGGGFGGYGGGGFGGGGSFGGGFGGGSGGSFGGGGASGRW